MTERFNIRIDIPGRPESPVHLEPAAPDCDGRAERERRPRDLFLSNEEKRRKLWADEVGSVAASVPAASRGSHGPPSVTDARAEPSEARSGAPPVPDI